MNWVFLGEHETKPGNHGVLSNGRCGETVTRLAVNQIIAGSTPARPVYIMLGNPK